MHVSSPKKIDDNTLNMKKEHEIKTLELDKVFLPNKSNYMIPDITNIRPTSKEVLPRRRVPTKFHFQIPCVFPVRPQIFPVHFT